MDESDESQASLLSNMNLATTPKQFFEGADDMLLRAAAVKKEAEELQSRVRMMHQKAYHLQEAAFNLQRLGMQDRDYSTKTLDRVLVEYKHVLPRAERAQPGVIDKLILAVEEGTALLEEVEGFSDMLQALIDHDVRPTELEGTNEDDSDNPETKAGEDKDSKDATGQLFRELLAKANAELKCKGDENFVIDCASESKEDCSDTKSGPSIKKTTAVPTKKTPKECKQISELGLNPTDVEDVPVSKRQRGHWEKQERKIAKLHHQGYEDSEIATFDLDEVDDPPPKQKKRKYTKKARKQPHASD